MRLLDHRNNSSAWHSKANDVTARDVSCFARSYQRKENVAAWAVDRRSRMTQQQVNRRAEILGRVGDILQAIAYALAIVFFAWLFCERRNLG